MKPYSFVVLGLLSVAVIAASAPSAPAAPAPAQSSAPMSKYQREHLEKLKISAPADRYFGRMKMSYLGINNTLHDAAITAGDHSTDPGIISKVGFAEDAIQDWERRYPHDPQLARSYYLGIAAEKKLWVQANQQHAWAYMNRLAQVFPDTYFGKLVKKEIARGFTEHYYSEPAPCRTAPPTPSPEPTPIPIPPTSTPSGRQRATPTPTPSPLATPAPATTPEPSPTPVPEPTQIAKGLKVQVLTPPCVPPPSPTPTPTATPSPAPATAAPSPAPAPSSPALSSPAPSSPAPQASATQRPR